MGYSPQSRRKGRALVTANILNFLLVSASFAAPAYVSSVFDNEKATLEIALRNSYADVEQSLKEKILSLLAGGNFVKSASPLAWPGDETFEVLRRSSSVLEKKYNRSFFTKFVNDRVMPDSVFTLSEHRVTCFDSSCTPQIEFYIYGPKQTYETPLEGSKSISLAKSFQIYIKAEPITVDVPTPKTPTTQPVEQPGPPVDGPSPTTQPANGTKFLMQLKVTGDAHQVFFKKLVEQKKLKEMPLDRDIKAAFLLWSQSAVKRFDW